ncbi:hypothetical protein PSQ90_10600 [Devosia rhodophyticola]|uniref:Uncharacterized protein n=1 Tax=Devosia rhodophyticola TaxID=3026423 RepID=A0ABY7YV04_9HYPH|nr:hypothetical protein PSQ90_10600 [Devosia rhodophyticola]
MKTIKSLAAAALLTTALVTSALAQDEVNLTWQMWGSNEIRHRGLATSGRYGYRATS